jgi:hypothetical protein
LPIKNIAEKIRDYWQPGQQTVPHEYFLSLRKHTRKTIDLAKLLRCAENGFAQACLGWLIYAELLWQLMLRLARQMKIKLLVLPPMLLVKQ